MSDKQNDKKTLCMTFDGLPVAVEIMQILAKFPQACRIEPENNLINIPDLN